MESLEDYLNTIFAWTNIINDKLCETKLSTSPLTYFDKHVDSRLSLTNVRPLPGLVSMLLHLCDTTASPYKKKHSNVKPLDPTHWQEARAFSIGTGDSIADCCRQASVALRQCVSAMLFHPDMFQELPIVTHDTLWRERETSRRTAAATIQLCYQYGMEGGARLDDSLKQKMDELEKHCPNLAVWYFLSSSDGRDEQIIRDLGGTRARKPRWTTSQALGDIPLVVPVSVPPDASLPPWATLIYNRENTTPVHRHRSTHQQPRHQWSNVVIPGKPRYRYAHSKPYRPRVDDYLQRGWIHAVREDSTFLIFHCGRYERIGIRHRASQTLYLSEVIDTTKFELYGKLQIGLYIAIIQDAMSRLDERLKQKTVIPSDRTLRKHKRGLSPGKMSKRSRNGTTFESLEWGADALHEISPAEMRQQTKDRKLALVSFCHDHYHRSPRPASFLRREVVHSKGWLIMTDFIRPNPRNEYPPSSYMAVTVGNYIGFGASGAVHQATLSIKRRDNLTSLLNKAAVKVVTEDIAKWRLEREYWVYKTLEDAKVDGIPMIFGLFQDVEEGWMMLIMSHTGNTLCSRKASLKAEEQLVSKVERERFLRILGRIHDAGVRHRDLRWENLTIGEDGRPYIIDFGAAHVDIVKKSRKAGQEVERMKLLLDGDEDANKISISQSDYDSDVMESRIRSLPRHLRSLLGPGIGINLDSDSESLDTYSSSDVGSDMSSVSVSVSISTSDSVYE